MTTKTFNLLIRLLFQARNGLSQQLHLIGFWSNIMTNLQSTLKSKNRDSTLPTKIHLVNAMIFSSGHGWMWEVDHKEGWKKVKAVQWYPTLCNPMDYTVHGILLARMLQWVAIPFSRESSQPRSPTLQVDSLPAEPPGKHKRRLSTEELMLLNCGVGEDSWGSLG